MLVIADKLRSGAEKRVVSWLRKWQDDYRVPGVAIANCFVSGQEVDLVIITPYTTVVCEIKGLNPGVTSGVLHCTTNSRWKVPGFDGDPVGVRQNDTTPYDQVRDGVFKVKNAAARAGGPAFVTGLVVVVPPRGSTLRLDKKSAPQGCDVLLCNTQNPLRAWFHRAHHRAAVVWTAEQAYALLEALEHGDSTTVAGLAAAGFPVEAPSEPAAPLNPPAAPSEPEPLVTASPRETPPKPGPPARPPAARARTPLPPPVSRTDEPAPARVEDPPPQRDISAPEAAEPEPFPPAPQPLPSPVPEAFDDRRRHRMHTAAAVAAIGVLAAAIWLVAQLGNGRTEPRGTTGQQQNSAVTDQTSVPPTPKTTSPSPPTACFPFQPNC
ncbi:MULTISPECIES: nuclease-related domain-containing protein [Nocardia]|uniref:nuclease-related domain-containing protein n=1 Tax=Nocardia TaxID=1817 RepID=UPI001893DE19|nr:MULTISPECIES: nuclease-related domain-containing protein [Nocardia]MBF6352170.1 NERD domain-containing protein [Nocardia flavorosea]